jgi:hypothetical protein
MILYRWHDNEKQLVMLDRETERPLWTSTFVDFKAAKACADAFQKLYDQGCFHGRMKALEEMQRTIDHIERNGL